MFLLGHVSFLCMNNETIDIDNFDCHKQSYVQHCYFDIHNTHSLCHFHFVPLVGGS